MTATYWESGQRIVEFEQGGKERAEYGAEVVERLALDLTARFGGGFGRRNVFLMRAFYLAYPHAGQRTNGLLTASPEKMQTVSAQSASSKHSAVLAQIRPGIIWQNPNFA